jgi:acetyl-CoA C-acetyltransferase
MGVMEQMVNHIASLFWREKKTGINMQERIAVIGIGQTEFKSRWPEISQVEMVHLAVKRALENAGMTMKDIDAVFIGNMELFEGIYQADMWLTEGSGAYMKSGMKIQTGGSTGSSICTTLFDHAATGMFNAVMGIGFEKQDEGSSDASLRSISEDTFFDILNGGRGAGPAMSEMAQDMLERKSVTEEQIARLRAQASENASRNPHAHLRKKLTVEEVIKSPYLIPPLRLLHMCPTSVGACAMVVAPEKIVKKFCPNPAWVIDWVTVHGGIQPILGHLGVYLAKSELGPLWVYGVEKASSKLYKRCGIVNPRKEIDVIEVYDMSTWHEAEWFERMHLCEKDGSGKLIDEGATSMNGDIPVNPSGGVVATNAIGASAMQRFAEAAIQVKNEGGERQVPSVKRALAVTAGGDSYSAAALFQKTPP